MVIVKCIKLTIHDSQLTTHNSQLTTHDSRFTTHSPLLYALCSMPSVHLNGPRNFVFTDCSFLPSEYTPMEILLLRS